MRTLYKISPLAKKKVAHSYYRLTEFIGNIVLILQVSVEIKPIAEVGPQLGFVGARTTLFGGLEKDRIWHRQLLHDINETWPAAGNWVPTYHSKHPCIIVMFFKHI